MARAEAVTRAHLELLFGFDAASRTHILFGLNADGSMRILASGMLEDMPPAARPILAAITPLTAAGLR